jgi:fucose 4-O-acetylase-like acetyltransferase
LRNQVINRSQGLVLAFLVCAVVALVAILIYAPDVYGSALRPRGQPWVAVETGFLFSLVACISLLALGVIRRWRWAFWGILLAFLAGVLRVPVSVVELLGVVPAGGPTWYMAIQAFVGLVQFGIGLALLRGYRRAGVWGAF